MNRAPARASFPLEDAEPVADMIAREIAEHVVRLEVVGSIRRRRPEVHDIEVLAEPAMVRDGLFGDERRAIEEIQRAAAGLGEVTRNGRRYIQVSTVFGVPGLKLDLFLCYPPAQWWTLMAIRTGPAQLSQLAVAQMRSFGFHCADGAVRDERGAPVPIDDEAAFFRCAGLRFVPPEQRHTPPAFMPEGVTWGTEAE